jgi:competence protein ComEC
VDLRLAWLAISVWFSTAVAIAIEFRFHPVWVVVWICVVVIGASALKQKLKFSKYDLRTISRFVFLGVVVGAIFATLRVLPLITGPIHDASKQGAIVMGTGVLSSDPITTQKRNALDWSSAQVVRFTMQVDEVNVHGTKSKLRMPVMVFSSNPEVLAKSEGLIPGQKVAFTGKLSAPLPGRAIAGNLTLTEPLKFLVGPPKYQWLAAQLRVGLHRSLVGTSPAAQGLVPGLALGDSSKLTPELADAMKAAGLTHLIAVSGTNVTLLVVVAMSLFRRSRVTRNYRYFLVILVLAAFVVIVRPQPSVLRAAVMGLVALFASYARSPKSPIPALCLAILVLIAIDPWMAVSYGFALSVGATFGLLLWSKRIFRFFDSHISKRVPLWVVETLVVTICAQAAVFPLMVALGSKLSLATIPANMIAVPLAGPTMLIGVLAALATPISPPVAHLIAITAALPANLIAKVAQLASQVTWLTIPWPHGLVGVLFSLLLVLSGVHIALVWRSLSIAKRSTITSVGITMFALLWIAPTVSLSNWPDPDWVMVSCDVGQGDAAVVKVGPHSAVVIDVGGDPDLVDHCLKRLHITTIPVLLLTHFHADHVGGLEGVLRNRKIGQIRISPLADPPATTKFVTETLHRNHLSASVMTFPEEFQINSVNFKCIWPRRLILGQGSDPNNASVALLVKTQGKTIFMTGDIEPAVQNEIMRDLGSIQVDVIKVPHHGSRNASAPFVTWVHASLALISVGAKNDYGHPASETIALYEMTGSKVFRTDTQGDLAVIVSGAKLRVATQR